MKYYQLTTAAITFGCVIDGPFGQNTAISAPGGWTRRFDGFRMSTSISVGDFIACVYRRLHDGSDHDCGLERWVWSWLGYQLVSRLAERRGSLPTGCLMLSLRVRQFVMQLVPEPKTTTT